jgi:hypothetical protein
MCKLKRRVIIIAQLKVDVEAGDVNDVKTTDGWHRELPDTSACTARWGPESIGAHSVGTGVRSLQEGV